MPRSFDAAINNVLDGGAIYWLCAIRPNTSDSWTAKAFGTLQAYSLSGYTVMTSRLLAVSAIDNKIDIYGKPLALVPDVDIEIQNIDGSVEPTDFIGRIAEIRFGAGTTMTEASSVVMFTGNIYKYRLGFDKVTFTARGKTQIANKPVGIKLPDNVHEKYRGKIYPMTYGSWLDDKAFMPAVMNRPAEKLPDMVMDTEAMKSLDDLMVYDEDNKTAYRSKNSDSFYTNSDKNIISIITDNENTMDELIGETNQEFSVGDRTIYDAFSVAYGAAPVIIKIGDELMLVIAVSLIGTGPYSTRVKVERGYFGTVATTHYMLDKVFLCNSDVSKTGILVTNVFYPTGVGGNYQSTYPVDAESTIGSRIFSIPESGRYDHVLDDDLSNYLKCQGVMKCMNSFVVGLGQYHLFNMYSRIQLVFPKIGIEGTVSKQYVLLKSLIRAFVPQAGYLDSKYYWMGISYTLSPVLKSPHQYTHNGGTYVIHEIVSDDSLSVPEWTGNAYILVELISGSTPLASGSLLGDITLWGRETIDFDSVGNSYCFSQLLLSKNSANVYQGLDYVTANAADSDVEHEFNNIDGSDSETDKEITAISGTGGVNIEDVSDLSGANYSLNYNLTLTPQMDAAHELTLYKIGMRLDFLVSPIKFYFWAIGEGRLNPGMYTGTAGTLMENPVTVIENFILTANNGGPIMTADQASFSAWYNDRVYWKLAHSVYCKDKTIPKFREEIEKMLECSGLLCFERYDSAMGIASLDAPSVIARTIDDSEVLISNGKTDIDIESEDTDIIITSIEIKYRPILPTGEWASTVYCHRSASGESPLHNFETIDASESQNLLQQAYETIGDEKPLVVEAPCIRDAATAERLAALIVKLRYKPLVSIKLSGTYSLLDIELCDKIGINISQLSATLNAKTYIVVGQRIRPFVNKSNPGVELTLLELGSATIEDAELWVEVGSGGSVKTEVGSGATDKYTEVGAI